MSVTLKVNNKIPTMVQRIQSKLRKLPQEAFQVFKDTTPIRTGNAKRHTTLKGNTIEANYPYAQVLDKGRHMTPRGMRGSEQAPEGMTKPTEDYIKQRLAQIFKAK